MQKRPLIKIELIEKLTNELYLDHKVAKSAVEKVLNYIADAIKEGRRVELRDIGSFEVILRNARVGRNPRSPGNKVIIPPRLSIRFKPARYLKDAVKSLPVEDFQKNKTDDNNSKKTDNKAGLKSKKTKQ